MAAGVSLQATNVKAFTEVNVNAKASIVTAVLSALPRANVPEPLGSIVILELLALVTILIAVGLVIVFIMGAVKVLFVRV